MALPVLKFVSILPAKADSVEKEFLSCLEQLFTKCETDFRIVKLTVFLHSDTEEAFYLEKELLSGIVNNRFSQQCPAFCIVAQSPAVPYSIGLEAVLIQAEDGLIFRQYNRSSYVVYKTEDYLVLWAAGLSSNNLMSVEEGSVHAFTNMNQILLYEGLDFNDIVRQWNYIPQICMVERENGLLMQHYQSFNEIRHAYYAKFRSKGCFPAATGIGQKFGNFVLDFMAFRCKQNCKDLKVESPLQRNPYQYGQEVLVGEPGSRKHAPEFERARIIVHANDFTILVSGTAAIEGEYSVDKDDVERQTHSTIRNIESLINAENLRSQYPAMKFKKAEVVVLRAYVKYREDIPVVAGIIGQKFENVSLAVVQAEICRCDLLVEIEAELFGVLN